MSLGNQIRYIKDKAEQIDLNVLFENPATYYSDLVELIGHIKLIEEPTMINIKDIKDKVYEG